MDRPGVSLVIRPAIRADLDAIVGVEDAAFSSDKASRRALLHAIGSPSIDCLVAEADGVVRGYASLERRRGAKAAHLASLAVAPSAGGRGLGRALLAAVEEAARAQGFPRLRLEAREDNAAARRLYEGAGYARIAVIDDYYEDGASAWRYEKGLRSPAV